MKENYNDLSKEELIEKLKNKDEQITEMSYKMDCMKADTTKKIEKIKNMRAEAFMELNMELNSENKELKNTIVRMCTTIYLSQDAFVTVCKNIDRKLDLILKEKDNLR